MLPQSAFKYINRSVSAAVFQRDVPRERFPLSQWMGKQHTQTQHLLLLSQEKEAAAAAAAVGEEGEEVQGPLQGNCTGMWGWGHEALGTCCLEAPSNGDLFRRPLPYIGKLGEHQRGRGLLSSGTSCCLLCFMVDCYSSC